MPFVTFGRPWGSDEARHSWVDIDGAAGTAAATRALTDAGYTAVAFIGWPDSSEVGRDRRAGWDSTLAAEVPRREERVKDDIGEGRAAMARLLAVGADAVVCASDSLATGAMLAWLDAHGCAPAGRLSPVAGFDDTALARYRGFSSARQPVDRAAQECLRLLVAQLEGKAEPEHLLLPPDVSYRSSAV